MSTSPDMTTVFHARLFGRFIEIQNNLRRKKLSRTNQSFNFLEGSFSSRDNVTTVIQFRRERQPEHFENDFSSKKDPSIFTSIGPGLLDQSET